MIRSVIGLLVLLAVCLAAAYLGSRLTRPSIPGWYAGLKKPWWTPPNWLFPPVWITLYVMMAVAAWLVWRQHGVDGASVALALFGAQLLLSVAWSALFFGLHSPVAAFVLILVLWGMILATMLAFWILNPNSASLLLPYLVWVSFAAALNFSIWRRNA